MFPALTFSNLLQERLHYETLSQHLNKLGEDAGKMVHRVIDLTRPEDLDGENWSWFFFCPFPSQQFLSLNVWPFALNPETNAGSPGGEKPTPPAAEKVGTGSTFWLP